METAEVNDDELNGLYNLACLIHKWLCLLTGRLHVSHRLPVLVGLCAPGGPAMAVHLRLDSLIMMTCRRRGERGGGGWGEGMRSPQLAPPRSVIIFKLCQAFSRMIDNGCMFYVRACFLYQFYRADLPLALFSYVTSFLRSFEFQISARRGPGESIDHSRHH